VAVFIAIALCILSVPAALAAGEVILAGNADDSLLMRIEDELRAAGETVTSPGAAASQEPTPGVITVEVSRSTGRILLFATDKNGRLFEKTVPLGDTATDGEFAAAMRTVEALRILRQEMIARTPDNTGAPFIEDEEPVARKRRGVFGFGLGPSIVWSRGGFEPVLSITPTIFIRVHDRIELGGRVDFPTRPMETRTEAGTARMKPHLATVALEFNPMKKDSPVRIPVAGVIGAAWSPDEGRADYPFAGRDGRLASFLVAARTGITIAVQKNARLRLDGTAGILLPEQRLLVDGGVAGRFGRPFLSGLAALELMFP